VLREGERGEKSHAPFSNFPEARGVVILSERAIRARAKDLLGLADSHGPSVTVPCAEKTSLQVQPPPGGRR